MGPTSRVAGRIAYRSGSGTQVGHEQFEILGHHGGYHVRALCEMDDVDLVRDVTIALDAAWRPLDGFVRITVGGQIHAAVWLGFDGAHATLEGQVRRDGALERVSDRLQRAAPPAYLGLHPLQGDALIVNCLPPGTPAGRFVAVDAVTNSASPDGDRDVGLLAMAIDLAFVGNETIEVAAGRFAARRFAIRWRKDWPAADLWVRDEDCIFLRLRWTMADRWYELVDLEER